MDQRPDWRDEERRGSGDPRNQQDLLLPREGRRARTVLYQRPSMGGKHARREGPISDDTTAAVVQLASQDGEPVDSSGNLRRRHGTSPYNDSFSVVGAEVVDVPAGRFST